LLAPLPDLGATFARTRFVPPWRHSTFPFAASIKLVITFLYLAVWALSRWLSPELCVELIYPDGACFFCVVRTCGLLHPLVSLSYANLLSDFPLG
jgi:hypothetical protein